MEQLRFPMLIDRHASRRKDPATSHAAEKKLKDTGAMATQQAACFSWLRMYPDHTCQELGRICEDAVMAGSKIDKLDSYDFARRLAELAEDHDKDGRPKTPLAKRMGTRICRVTKHRAAVWAPADWNPGL